MKLSTLLFILLTLFIINPVKAQTKLRIYLPNTCVNSIPTKANSTYYETLFELYPNPSNGIVTIDFEETFAKTIQIKLIGLQGRIFMSENFIILGNKLTIDVCDIPKGIYILQLNNRNHVSHKKLVIN